MKKLSTIIMALALVLGMSQCKKQETPTNGNSGEMVHITLNVNDSESLAVNVNDNGGRHAVAPNLGVIQFTNGDKLYVGNNGHYVGYLQYVVDQSGRRFDGYIDGTACSTSDKLHFYFLGGKEPATAPTEGTTTDFTISIDNQTSNLPVLCYGKSNENYSTNGSYTATLEYKCALVKFNLNKETSYSCILSNMPTEATISFATTAGDDFTPIAKTSTTGTIDLYREEGNTGVRWAILLPGTNLSDDGNVSGAPSGTLNANQFINSGITLTNPVFAAPDAQYAVKTSGGVLTQFSVSSTQKVYFSRANLRYGESLSSIPGWSLHAHQFDEHEDAYGEHGYNNTYTGYNATYDLDRICWGRLANDGNYTYTAGGSWIYADNLDLTRTNGTDWGTVLSGEGNDKWRMLTADEWDYLFNATARGDRRFIKVNVRDNAGVGTAYGVHVGTNFGVLLLPDNYAGTGLSTPLSSFNNGNGKKFNTIDLKSDGTDDVSKMLNAGAVFLPALGYRNADQFVTEQYQEYTYYNIMSVDNFYQSFGYYWSSTRVNSYGVNETDRMAKVLTFNKEINAYSEMLRGRGACVRLVWDAN